MTQNDEGKKAVFESITDYCKIKGRFISFQKFENIVFPSSFGSHNPKKCLASLCTFILQTRALWDIPVTQGGSKWWSDKSGYLSVSVPCFSNNCRQSWVIQITFCYKLVLFARHTLELCPCLVLMFFFSSCFASFFSVTCCSQLSILAVLLSVSLPRSWHVVAVTQQVIN